MSLGPLLDDAALVVVVAALRWTPALLLAAVVATLARRGSAAARHAAWAGALLAGAMVLVGASWLPRWQLPAGLSGRWAEGAAEAVAAALAAGDAGAPSPADLAAEVVPHRRPVARHDVVTAPRPAPWRWAASLWLTGCALLLGRELARWRSAARVLRGCRDARLPGLPLAGRWAAGRPALRVGPVAVPAVAGLLRPRVVLPAAAERWPQGWLRAALLHELAHVERRDLAWLLLARLLRAVFWFHPGAWVVPRRLAAEAELACDERAVAAGVDAVAYAGALVEIAGAARRAPSAVPLLAVVGRPSELRRRVARLLSRRPPATSRWAGWLAAALALAGGALGAAEPGRVVPSRPAGGDVAVAASVPLRPLGGDEWALRCPPGDGGCRELTEAALARLRREGVAGVVLAQRVDDGRLAAYAAVRPGAGPQPGVPALAPGSLAKLPLAAAWWESGLPEPELRCTPDVPGARGVTSPVPAALRDRPLGVGDMLVHSCTSAAVRLAEALAAARGGTALPAALAPLLAPPAAAGAAADLAAFAASADVDWPLQAGGVGPLTTTPLLAAGWLRAVARDGVAGPAGDAPASPRTALVSPRTAALLRHALREAVARGTARAAADAGGGAWSLAGKTGTVTSADGALDGWFAGLVEGADGQPGHVVVVWLQGAGPGGGRPTRLAADLARVLGG